MRQTWVSKLNLRNFRTILAGHYHRNAEGVYDKHLNMITTSALGAQSPTGANAKSGYRVVHVGARGQNVTTRYVNIDTSKPLPHNDGTAIILTIGLLCFSIMSSLMF